MNRKQLDDLGAELWTAWTTDREIVPMALQAIRHALFPTLATEATMKAAPRPKGEPLPYYARVVFRVGRVTVLEVATGAPGKLWDVYMPNPGEPGEGIIQGCGVGLGAAVGDALSGQPGAFRVLGAALADLAGRP